MKKLIPFLFLSVFALNACNNSIEDFTYHNDNVSIIDNMPFVIHEHAHVVFLYGQSNADGCTQHYFLQQKDSAKYNEYLNGYNNVFINFVNDNYNNSSENSFRKCTLGCGAGTITFGPEMGIAEIMSKTYPREKTFIIKWTWGGTALHNQWLNSHQNRGQLYNDAMDFTLKNLSYLKHKGYDISLDGIAWMQGESDSPAKNENQYYNDTKSFVELLRRDLGDYQRDIRFVDAGINEEPGIWIDPQKINAAKKRFANESALNYYIDPVELGLSSVTEPDGNVDFAHYDSLSMVKLGQAFGEIISQ